MRNKTIEIAMDYEFSKRFRREDVKTEVEFIGAYTNFTCKAKNERVEEYQVRVNNKKYWLKISFQEIS